MRSRSVLALLVVFAAGDLHALGERDRFAIAEIADFGPQPEVASATRQLLWEIDKRTSIDVATSPAVVKLTDEAALRRYPMLYLRGSAAFTLPEGPALAALRSHLHSGGLLLIDGVGQSFDASARALVAQLFPGKQLEKLTAEDVIYRSFYLLRTPVGRVASQPFLEAIFHDGRTVVLYSQNDLGGAWARNAIGQWEHDVVPGGESQREMAFRLGVNIAMYALCLDYKTDQVHVPFILRRRKWQSE